VRIDPVLHGSRRCRGGRPCRLTQEGPGGALFWGLNLGRFSGVNGGFTGLDSSLSTPVKPNALGPSHARGWRRPAVVDDAHEHRTAGDDGTSSCCVLGASARSSSPSSRVRASGRIGIRLGSGCSGRSQTGPGSIPTICMTARVVPSSSSYPHARPRRTAARTSWGHRKSLSVDLSPARSSLRGGSNPAPQRTDAWPRSSVSIDASTFRCVAVGADGAGERRRWGGDELAHEAAAAPGSCHLLAPIGSRLPRNTPMLWPRWRVPAH
jgi:hypothetical protein